MRALVLLTLCACGGGGNAAPTIANRPGTTPPPPASTATPACKAAVAKNYEVPPQLFVNPTTGAKVVVTSTDECGIVLEPVFFERGSARLFGDGADRLVTMLACIEQTEHLTFRFELTGHASSDERQPEELGLARAKALERYLLDCGVPVLGLTVRSAADREPVDTAGTERAYARNRRVHLLVLERSRPDD